MNGLSGWGCRRSRRHPLLTPAAGLGWVLVCLSVAGCGRSASNVDPVVARGKILYEVSCGSCHRTSGVGEDGVAAPLAGSPWVEGSEQRLVRIALHGVRGPIEVNGRTYNLEMPGFKNTYGDEEMSAILSYARQAWGNRAPSIPTETVAAIRATEARRGDSWTAEELMEW